MGGFESTDDDSAIVRASVSEPQRFGEIFRRHHLAVWRYLARLGGADAADDLAGDVFVAAFAQRGGFDPARGSVPGWLYGIATNLNRTHARSATRRTRALRRMAVEDGKRVSQSEAAEEALWTGQELVRVRGAVAGLSQAHREVLVLVAWEGLSYEEVASVLKLEVGTVRSRLSRARSELRRVTAEASTTEVKR